MNDALAFLRRGHTASEPREPLPMSNEHFAPKSISPHTAGILEGITRTAEEKELLERENASLRAELAQARMENNMLRQALDEAEYKRDFYLRQATSLMANLHTINTVIVKATQEANEAGLEVPTATERRRATEQNDGFGTVDDQEQEGERHGG